MPSRSAFRTRDEDELVRMLEIIEPSFGGINLEDIAQPKCFRVHVRKLIFQCGTMTSKGRAWCCSPGSRTQSTSSASGSI